MENTQPQQAKRISVKKVLVIGSGGLSIGQAGEFDYSGSQALKSLREEGITTILVNPNIATIQTSEGIADRVYLLPITPEEVEKIIIKEKPDGILLGFGGQTALNCGVELYRNGVLEKYSVAVLGTPVKTIIDTEDRDLFVQRMKEAGLDVPNSKAVEAIEDGLKAAQEIGYPVMIRVAYALGGLGSGAAYNETELKEMLTKAFANASQVLVEEYLGGWKEIEYEVVRDAYDNCITVCNMENFDPMGIHTGESIVVAPSQTLTNSEYHTLRLISIRAIRHLGIIGECNIQFALSPHSEEYRIIEVNARLSRSSALASKATGYPLAFIAAKLALGYSLVELRNSITRSTTACFEPALDYIVVKVPRWGLSKFKNVSTTIGSGMKSVGEIMAIGRNFEEALQKAIRMLDIGRHGLVGNRVQYADVQELLKTPTEDRIFRIAQALQEGVHVDEINKHTRIDRWFLYKMQHIVQIEESLKQHTLENLPKELLQTAKQFGFSDFQIARCVCSTGTMKENTTKVREHRKKLGIIPYVKQIDTLGAEYPAKTNYLYLTYNATEDDITAVGNSVVVLGGGPYRIGSSVEFDWCCVNAVLTLKKLTYSTIVINCNPETVSTDYDICDRLYFEELSLERVMDIYDKEKPLGIIVSMGGQVANNLALRLHTHQIPVLGTSPIQIDRAEDRHKFSKLLDTLHIDQPPWKELTTLNEAETFAQQVGYPVLVRPSYVLSGAAMSVAFDDTSLEGYLKKASDISKEHPVVITKFLLNAREIELDGVAYNGIIMASAITEHVENAGVHSGDATMVLPPQKTYLETIKRIRRVGEQIARALEINGPFNIQFLAKNNQIKVIECNLRASRSFPFVSKVMKTNFADIATRVIMDHPVSMPNRSSLDLDYVGVKSPQFSFARLTGADPVLGVEMASTGEVACLGDDLHEAFLKSIVSSGYKLPKSKSNVLISISGEKPRYSFLPEARLLHELGFTIYATEHTAQFLSENGITNTMIYKAHNPDKENNVVNYMQQRKLDLVISVPNPEEPSFSADHYVMRRKAVDLAIPLLMNLQVAKIFVQSLYRLRTNGLELKTKAWDEYQ